MQDAMPDPNPVPADAGHAGAGRPLPIVSVIIPAHQAAGHLGAAIASVQAQTLAAVEAIVVDDGSSDGTWALIAAAAASDPRIRGLRRPAAGGPAAARNAGLRLARGAWVAPLDADDTFRPDRLARLVAAAEALGADLVADDQLVWPEGAKRPTGLLFGRAAMAGHAGPLTLAELARRDMPGMRGAAIGYAKPLVRRDFLTRHGIAWEAAARSGEDLLFLADCVAHGGRFWLLPAARYVYRRRAVSESRRPGLARLQAATNRRLRRLARGVGDAEAQHLLRQRQDLLDRAALADAAGAAEWAAAFGGLRWLRPRLLAGDARLLLGALRRRLLRHGATVG